MIAAEIQPVREVDGAMEWCDAAEAEVFGVYTRDEDGLAVWVADCATHDDARRLVSALADGGHGCACTCHQPREEPT